MKTDYKDLSFTLEKACQNNKVMKLLSLYKQFSKGNGDSKHLKTAMAAKPLMNHSFFVN